MIRLSKRLQAVADFVPEGGTLADIGTDHAYLPIYLTEAGRISGAVAADVREGPLAHAAANIEAAGLSGRIRTCLSDGLENIPPDICNVLSIAGMGGMLMIRILKDGDISGFETFVLAPQSDLTHFRTQLMRLHLRIEQETLVSEDGKYYPVMCAVHGADPDEDPVRLKYGKHLMPEAYPVLRNYLACEHDALAAASAQIAQQTPEKRKPAARERYDELQEEIRLNETALSRMVRQERL